MKTPRRKVILAVPALAAGLLLPRRAHAEFYNALLCGDCSFGSKKDDCARCGKWIGSTRVPARLCSDHGFGSKKENCARCGKWVGSNSRRAFVCGDCGFGSKKENCVICGKWAP